MYASVLQSDHVSGQYCFSFSLHCLYVAWCTKFFHTVTLDAMCLESLNWHAVKPLYSTKVNADYILLFDTLILV